jgi:hypothetical protein
MIEIKYKGNFEAAEMTGRSIAEARMQYKKEFSIMDKAAAYLNGKKVLAAKETATILNDDDRLTFKAAGNHRLAFLAGGMLLAMAITGGVFAYGFTNSTATIGATTISSNFADVTANTSSPVSWTVRGMQKGQTGAGTLFDIDTAASGYPGDLAATVSIANGDELVKVYRSLILRLEVRDAANNLVDINGDSVANANDFTLLSLDNGTAVMAITQGAASTYTVKVTSGSFIAHAAGAGWSSSYGAPQLFCEVAQR